MATRRQSPGTAFVDTAMDHPQSEEALQLSHLTSTSLTATVSRSTLSSDPIRGESWEDDGNLLTAQSSHSRPRAYQPLTQSSKTPAGYQTQGQSRSICATAFSQAVAFFWLLPVIALIVLNLRGLVIGAGAWCPQGKCYSDNYNTTIKRGQFEQTRARLEMSSRNLLGALQLAAKALEIWLALITTSLVYILTMKLAKDGLPVKYILRPSEFTELSGFFDMSLWRTPFSHDPRRIYRIKLPDLMLTTFLLVTVILCILCNLMGPAVAVLIIPNQQWYSVDIQRHETFVSMNGNQPPAKSFSDRSDCNDSFVKSQNYSCAATWAAQLDQSMAYVSDSSLIGHHKSLSFLIYNDSFSDDADFTLWAANRGALGALSEDVSMLTDGYFGYSDDTLQLQEMNKDWIQACSRSLQTSLRRTGPILGAQIFVSAGNNSVQAWTTVVDEARSIRCYPGYPISPRICMHGCWTKCIAIGSGWNDGYKTAAFGLGRDNQTAGLQLSIHATGHTAYLLSEEVGRVTAEGCLVNGTIEQDVRCNWETFFEPRPTDHEAFQLTYGFLNTIELASTIGPPYLSLTLDYVGLLTFAEYELNPSLYDNPMLFTTISSSQYENRNYTNIPIKIDPSWFLATWAVNPNTIVSGRVCSNQLLRAFDQLVELSERGPLGVEDIWDVGDDSPEGVMIMSMVQMLSWVSFETTNSSSSKVDINHPSTGPRPQIFTWAYGMKAHPRSEILAIIVALSGCIVVLIQCAVAIMYRDKYWSTSQLLAAALKYSYQREFDGLRAKNIGQVSLKLQSDGSSAIGFKFEKAD